MHSFPGQYQRMGSYERRICELDVQGLTSTEHMQAALCEWVEPGSSGLVFPNAGSAAIEQAGMLNGLLPA